ncbi:cold-shock protein [Sphingobacterium psychroaquaticum]|uniref:Cold shock protein, CspA family n=1 Tax=Sphingobacterium psychroaquaticum TaxID=561061 RepID=A0A1X7I1I8_9SPHI|nr:cold-shock protein [Sphingobacterium psychroaquaticum]SMG08266.1 hypothetical protein SAMN05660862_0365 [Sphingobacterium psychroaquaticum]
MARNQITSNKKDRAKKQQQKKQQKLEKKEFNKANNDKGKALEEMFAYVDEFGNLTDTPPEKKYEFKEEHLTRPEVEEDEYRHGKVSYYNHEGHYGFIRDNENKQTAYFNDKLIGMVLRLDQKVKYKTIRGKQGEQVSEVIIEN